MKKYLIFLLCATITLFSSIWFICSDLIFLEQEISSDGIVLEKIVKENSLSLIVEVEGEVVLVHVSPKEWHYAKSGEKIHLKSYITGITKIKSFWRVAK